jgi:L-asparaginase
LKKIKIIELGGTIASIANNPCSEFYKRPTSSITNFLQEFDLPTEINICTELFLKKISHELTIKDLIDLSNKISSALNNEKMDGVVVTTGTNALEDIAYFIGLVVNTEKPIVFTGSNFPQNSLLFDGKKNLFNAIKIACSEKVTKLGVIVTFNDYLVTAREATKINSDTIQNFSFQENGVIGYIVGGEIVIKAIPAYRHTYKTNFSLQSLTSLPTVAIVYGHLGINAHVVRSIAGNAVHGIISAGFGRGYQPEIVTLALYDAVQSGVSVVRCARTGYTYSGIDKFYDEKYGFVVARGLSPQKASLLLSIALTTTKETGTLQKYFEEY